NDLDRFESRLGGARDGDALGIIDAPTELRVRIEVAPRLPLAINGGAPARENERAAAAGRTDPARPPQLGHVVHRAPSPDVARALFVDGLGFKVSDEIKGLAAFLRCSTDHHNLLVQGAPVPMLHHTSWMLADADDVGRAGNAMVAADPDRHLWGLGRHY